jgi:rhodanese-related sulfurtransferase
MSERPLEISVSEAAAALREPRPPLLLDCRTAEEFQTARIAGAMLLPMQELPDRVGELAGREAEPIIVHCHHGMRSLRVTKWLRDRGFALAQSMAGGIDAWSEEIDSAVPKY